MNFVSKTDFNFLPYNIPFEGVSDATFDAFVEDEQAKILKQVLGIQLYTEFMDALEEDYPDQKWIDLRDGAQYSFDGITYEWAGMTTRTGLIAPYIYCLWLAATWDTHTKKGIVAPNAENSQVISPASRMGAAFSKFLELLGRKPKVVSLSALYIPTPDFMNRNANTLLGFLTVNINNYSSLAWTDPGRISQFDL